MPREPKDLTQVERLVAGHLVAAALAVPPDPTVGCNPEDFARATVVATLVEEKTTNLLARSVALAELARIIFVRPTLLYQAEKETVEDDFRDPITDVLREIKKGQDRALLFVLRLIPRYLAYPKYVMSKDSPSFKAYQKELEQATKTAEQALQEALRNPTPTAVQALAQALDALARYGWGYERQQTIVQQVKEKGVLGLRNLWQAYTQRQL